MFLPRPARRFPAARILHAAARQLCADWRTGSASLASGPAAHRARRMHMVRRRRAGAASSPRRARKAAAMPHSVYQRGTPA